MVQLVFPKFPLRKNIEPLVYQLRGRWVDRYQDQRRHICAQNAAKDYLGRSGRGQFAKRLGLIEGDGIVQAAKSYEELPRRELFSQVFRLFLDGYDAIPESKEEVFIEMANLAWATLA
jgi:hypothetical protein